MTATVNLNKDIQALRAIAVLMVLFYHFEMPPFGGGFVGVDVFFVLSGFLITQQLLRLLQAGQFSYKIFCHKRINRLLPAMLLVTTVTFVVVARFYTDEELYIYAKSWMASITGTSNFFYLNEFKGYFAPDASDVALLHTWSLAVEIQFYLLWPWVMMLLHKFKLPVRQGLLGVVLAFFVLNLALTHYYPDAAYFLLPARLFEFAMGGWVAAYAFDRAAGAPQLINLSNRTQLVWRGLAIIALIVSGCVIEKTDSFPGWAALIPTLATAVLVLLSLEPKLSSLGGFWTFSNPVLQYLGKISYSLYLWHWPALVVVLYWDVPLTLKTQGVLWLFSLVASSLTYRFIEQPFRQIYWQKLGRALAYVFCFIFFIWLVQLSIRTHQDLTFRIPESNQALYKVVARQNTGKLFKPCFGADDENFVTTDVCQFGDEKTNKPMMFLVGDSHATAAIGFWEKLAADANRQFLAITKASTAFLVSKDGAHFFGRAKQQKRNMAIQAYLESAEPTTVLLSNRWGAYFMNEQFGEYLAHTIGWLNAQGHEVLILSNVPELTKDNHAYCLLKNKTECDVPFGDTKRNLQTLQTLIDDHQLNAQLLDVVQWMCDDTSCISTYDGTPLYRDKHHLNHVGAQILGDVYLEKSGNPLRSAK